jgi:hypothetical protein
MQDGATPVISRTLARETQLVAGGDGEAGAAAGERAA